MYEDPFRKDIPNTKLVLCECYDDFKCTEKNSFNFREALAKIQEKNSGEFCWAGIE